MNSKNIDEQILFDIIVNAIEQGKLFELLFTEKGQKLWKNFPEKTMKTFVKKALKLKNFTA